MFSLDFVFYSLAESIQTGRRFMAVDTCDYLFHCIAWTVDRQLDWHTQGTTTPSSNPPGKNGKKSNRL